MAKEEKKETASETPAAEAAQPSQDAARAEAAATPEAAADAAGETAEAAAEAAAPEGEAAKTAEEPAKAAEKGPAPAPSAEPDWKDLYARLRADFDNFKKRTARDREDTYRFAEADILKDVLPAVDNLQLALANAKDKADDPFVKGVQLVHDTLLKSLKDHDAEPFDSVGLELDTERMEAITTMPSEEIAEGKVVAEAKKGWLLKGKTLRAAQVVVSSGKPA